jgi:hypothetical protein
MTFKDVYASQYFDEIKGYIKPTNENKECFFCGEYTCWVVMQFGEFPLKFQHKSKDYSTKYTRYKITPVCSPACLDAFKAQMVMDIIEGYHND